jgi:hypothetical protein
VEVPLDRRLDLGDLGVCRLQPLAPRGALAVRLRRRVATRPLKCGAALVGLEQRVEELLGWQPVGVAGARALAVARPRCSTASCGPQSKDALPQFTFIAGGLEDSRIREEVCRVLEGGAAAFKERAKRLRVYREVAGRVLQTTP